MPNQIKIGPVEQIRELINVALPGIAIRALPVAPRQLPYYAGTSYFELDRSSPYWAALARAGGVAIHIAGEIPRSGDRMLGDPRMTRCRATPHAIPCATPHAIPRQCRMREMPHGH